MTTRLRVVVVVATSDLLLRWLSELGLRGACDELSACGVDEPSIDEVNRTSNVTVPDPQPQPSDGRLRWSPAYFVQQLFLCPSPARGT
jgi:hypothetical protein